MSDKYRLGPEIPAFGLHSGDILDCDPEGADPWSSLRLKVNYRVSDGYQPHCAVLRSQCDPVAVNVGSATIIGEGAPSPSDIGYDQGTFWLNSSDRDVWVQSSADVNDPSWVNIGPALLDGNFARFYAASEDPNGDDGNAFYFNAAQIWFNSADFKLWFQFPGSQTPDWRLIWTAP